MQSCATGNRTLSERIRGSFWILPYLTEKNCPWKATPVLEDPVSRKLWDEIAPGDREATNQVFSNIGKAIVAFEWLIVPTLSRFDQYVEAPLQGDFRKMKALLSPDEIEGMRLFIGKGKCVKCHSTPPPFLQTMIFILSRFRAEVVSHLIRAGLKELRKSLLMNLTVMEITATSSQKIAWP